VAADEPTQADRIEAEPEPEWGRWKTAAVIVGYVLGLSALAVASWWMWGVFIRMRC
jgi:hypothetical protein